MSDESEGNRYDNDSANHSSVDLDRHENQAKKPPQYASMLPDRLRNQNSRR